MLFEGGQVRFEAPVGEVLSQLQAVDFGLCCLAGEQTVSGHYGAEKAVNVRLVLKGRVGEYFLKFKQILKFLSF